MSKRKNNMGQDGEICLDRLKASYSLPDIILVPKDKVEQADEARLYFEVSLSIGLTLGGALVGNFSLLLLVTSIAFIAFAGFSLWRYIVKRKEVNKHLIKPLEKKE